MFTAQIIRAALILAALSTIGCAGAGSDPTTTGTGGATMAPDAGTATPDADPTPVTTCSPAVGTKINLTPAQIQAFDGIPWPIPVASVSADEPNPTSAVCAQALAAVQKLSNEGQVQIVGSTTLYDVIPYDCDKNGQNCDEGQITAVEAVVGGACHVQVTAEFYNVSGTGVGGGDFAPDNGCNIQIVTVSL
jgi:hypothetical protein